MWRALPKPFLELSTVIAWESTHTTIRRSSTKSLMNEFSLARVAAESSASAGQRAQRARFEPKLGGRWAGRGVGEHCGTSRDSKASSTALHRRKRPCHELDISNKLSAHRSRAHCGSSWHCRPFFNAMRVHEKNRSVLRGFGSAPPRGGARGATPWKRQTELPGTQNRAATDGRPGCSPHGKASRGGHRHSPQE